jgi:hypothetical protein
MREDNLQSLPEPEGTISIRPLGTVSFGRIAHVMFVQYPKRTALGLSLMIGQAFIYNAVYFTYSLVLTTFYHLPARMLHGT